MQKIFYSLILFSFAAKISQAQITITSADMPAVNDTLRVSQTNNLLNLLNPDSTGANYTWNYDSLVPQSQDVEHFVPNTTGNYFFFPFISSYGYKTNKIDTTNRIDFFKNGSSSYRQVGYGQKVNSIPAPIVYNPYDTIYRFPLMFGKKDSCKSGFGLPIPGIGYYGQKQKRVNVVDGWGTLITPYGTFQTLRVKSTLYQTDTLYLDTLHTGFNIPLPVRYEYKWLANGKKIPLLLVLATDVAGFPLVTNVIYRDSMRTGIVQVAVQEISNPGLKFQVYPNPAHDFIFVTYLLEKAEQVKIDLFDIAGKKVCALSDKKQTDGEHVELINLSEKKLQSGIYFIRINSGDKENYLKIVLE